LFPTPHLAVKRNVSHFSKAGQQRCLGQSLPLVVIDDVAVSYCPSQDRSVSRKGAGELDSYI
jgi:hypothetical protein